MKIITKFFPAYEDLFRPPALHKVVEHEMLEATREAEQARVVIRNHQFQLHMAKARMKALEDWNHNGPEY